VTCLLLDADGQKVRGYVLVNFEAKRFPNPQTGGTAQNEHHPLSLLLPLSQSRHDLGREAWGILLRLLDHGHIHEFVVLLSRVDFLSFLVYQRRGGACLKLSIDNLEQAAVAQQCRVLRLPAVADQCASLAEEAIKQRLTYLRYLEVLLATELEERERNTIARRIKDAHLPRMKMLDEFDFSKATQIQATNIHELAQGGYIERAEPIILIGDCGTGKTHLLTGLCVAACRRSDECALPPPRRWSSD
jgi:hypothetical protein